MIDILLLRDLANMLHALVYNIIVMDSLTLFNLCYSCICKYFYLCYDNLDMPNFRLYVKSSECSLVILISGDSIVLAVLTVKHKGADVDVTQLNSKNMNMVMMMVKQLYLYTDLFIDMSPLSGYSGAMTIRFTRHVLK